ncbi:VOC family protein [Aureimonas sp. AU4]|uniref:VOC family protein n=1 Tax=Aureimonas sp. AU4 TaxID=1638163 RepID=UPI0007828F07|nr:VOC family protein [Aureimonas sp. AU4]
MPIEALHHVQLAMPAGEEAAARRFYGEVLGMREQPKPEALRGRGGVWFASGAAEVHLGVEPDFRPARKAHPALRVSNLAALRARLEAAGHATRDDEPLPGFRRFYADDPFGNRIEFLEPA